MTTNSQQLWLSGLRTRFPRLGTADDLTASPHCRASLPY